MLASVPELIASPAWKTPKITYQVDLLQVISILNTQTTPQNKYSRVASVKIDFSAIKKALITSALDRTFAAIASSVNQDLNPESRASDYLQIDVAQAPTNAPSVFVDVNTDDTGTEEIVNVSIQIISVKVEFLTSAFDRIKTYVTNTLTTDLNP
ncbi:MAG TPA: hypothetical protein IGS40_07800 [Trichormus sp. M33_DOE_039]|nr:hypothetical protein [Trichormus sp. M33_DOE_039]